MSASEAAFLRFVAGYPFHEQGSPELEREISNTTNLVVGASEAARLRRLKLYSKQHNARAVSELSTRFEATCRALGSDRFEQIVRLFLDRIPSTTPRLRWLGCQFSEFLRRKVVRELLRDQKMPWLPDIAELDWARSLVADAPEAEALSYEGLRSLTAKQCTQMKLVWRPCVQRLDSTHDILTLHHELLFAPCSGIQTRRSQTPSPSPSRLPNTSLPEARRILLSELDGHCVERELSARESSLFDALSTPLSLIEFTERVASQFELDVKNAACRSVTYLQKWCELQCLQSLEPEVHPS